MPELAQELVEFQEKPWQPARFKERHRLVCKLQAVGLKNNEIADITGYTESRVSIILNDPRAPAIINEMAGIVAGNLDDVALKLKLLANEALDTVTDLMRDGEKEEIRQRSAFSILDRAGYSKIEKKLQITAAISNEAAELLVQAASDGNVIDADYTITKSG